jgi:hypothetical protein
MNLKEKKKLFTNSTLTFSGVDVIFVTCVESFGSMDIYATNRLHDIL